MTVIETLDADYNPDYWADRVRPALAGALAALEDHGWDELDAAWPGRPTGWRLRLADALAIVDHPRAIALLTHMLAAPEPEVGGAVAEALLELDYQWSPAVSLRADLERHLAAAPPSARPPIQRLLGRLPA